MTVFRKFLLPSEVFRNISKSSIFIALWLFCCPSPTFARGHSENVGPGLSQLISPLVDRHPGQSAAQVLEKGEESLLARAWLTDHAEAAIDVQYFIWSTDNVGILAAEALLGAAERGVKVRVLVDDLLVDASAESLLALALHPRIEIRIYNPLHSVGTSKAGQIANLVTDFRSANQRMHDKTFMVDGRVAITGGRNMADEYFDFDQRYNFRDRDILLLGPVVEDMERSFERFWQSPLAVPVADLLRKEVAGIPPWRIGEIYAELHAYAGQPENFAPEVRQALTDLPKKFPALIETMVWDEMKFLSDLPGKNAGDKGLGGGGRTTSALVSALRQAQKTITIQTPYLVMPEGGLELFRGLVARGVKVRISTNSLASTDNLQAFSGYRKQRRELLQAGIEIREFRPDPAIRTELIERYPKLKKHAPIFALHAKTLVIDGEILFIGTFNLDPRSANLNTEVGVLVTNAELATQAERAIEQDMAPANSWNAATDNPDAEAGFMKRMKLRFWKLLPLDPIL